MFDKVRRIVWARRARKNVEAFLRERLCHPSLSEDWDNQYTVRGGAAMYLRGLRSKPPEVIDVWAPALSADSIETAEEDLKIRAWRRYELVDRVEVEVETLARRERLHGLWVEPLEATLAAEVMKAPPKPARKQSRGRIFARIVRMFLGR